MNAYRAFFFVRCPVNGDRVHYCLQIESKAVIMVEAIEAAIDGLPDAGLHEAIADSLHAQLGGRQTIRGTHRRVRIETARGEL